MWFVFLERVKIITYSDLPETKRRDLLQDVVVLWLVIYHKPPIKISRIKYCEQTERNSWHHCSCWLPSLWHTTYLTVLSTYHNVCTALKPRMWISYIKIFHLWINSFVKTHDEKLFLFFRGIFSLQKSVIIIHPDP